MSNSPVLLLSSGVLYLFVLFLVAHLADRKIIPEKWVNNPWVYGLSLGVYATSWSFYGSVGFAQNNGLLFIAIYIGATLAFLLSPILLSPILRLAKEYQLASLADLFAFRYRSQSAGVIVTLFMLIGTLPYIALQIKAITDSMQILTDEIPSEVIAIGFCFFIVLFSILFGAKHISPREKHTGLVAAIAFESLIKLLAILTVTWFAIDDVFGGLGQLNTWLTNNPQVIEALYKPVHQAPWTVFLFLAFSAAFLLPRQFHMLFTENQNPKHLKHASWIFPLFLLAFNIAIPIILFSGLALNLTVPADYYILGIALNTNLTWLPIFTFIGGLSASSAMIVVTTLALSSMCLNHLVLPIKKPSPKINLYTQLLWSRRILIGVIIFLGYVFYAAIKHNQGLVQIGLISFVAVAQFIPGIVGLLYWRQVTKQGFISGLLAGITIWFFSLILPILVNSNILQSNWISTDLHTQFGLDKWVFSTLVSLFFNLTFMVIVTLFTKQSLAEKEAANACCKMNDLPSSQGVINAISVEQFENELAISLGKSTAKKEIQHALDDLNMLYKESNPTNLKKLRSQLEQNLSGLIGPQLSHVIINQRLQLDTEGKIALADSIHYIESKIADSNSQLMGLSSEIIELGKMHRQILQTLPLGVCVVDYDNNILIWNDALTNITSIHQDDSKNFNLDHLEPVWRALFKKQLLSSSNHLYLEKVELDGKISFFNLHRSLYLEPLIKIDKPASFGTVILLEDLTKEQTLELELERSNRLASIGRLAAGVSHEIGNPITNISCIVQNLQFENKDDHADKNYQGILEQCDRINVIIKTLTNYSRNTKTDKNKQSFDLNNSIQSAISLINLSNKNCEIQFINTPEKNYLFSGDEQSLSQAFINIISNAIDASQNNTAIQIQLKQTTEHFEITIKDEGMGISADVLNHIFDPFYTTKPAGKGTGLGLSITHKIIQEHNGTIKIQSQLNQGTQVIITLPINSDI